METFIYKLRFLFVGLLILGSLLLLSLLVSSAQATAEPSSSDLSSNVFDGSNAVTNSAVIMGESAGKALDTTEQALASSGKAMQNGLRSAGSAVATSGKHVANGGKRLGLSLYAGGMDVASGVTSTIGFAAGIPGSALGYVSNTALVSAVIKPANSAESAPVIDQKTANFYETRVALAKLSAANPASPAAAGETPAAAALASASPDSASWPIHGAITTLFGVPHWPYQPTHTGIDISDGQRSGVTPIKPYKSGKVVEAVWSNVSLGNHVVIDHGGGVTSVYGHMYSLSVQVGQEVTKDTTLGFEGSTGASTGTHLHFEIRINGEYVNPLDYVAGQP